MRRESYKSIITLAALLVFGSCAKDQQSGVPPTFVDITINVNLPAFADIAVPGGWVYLTGGAQGLIVYRRSTDEFTALDRFCTYQPQNACKVVVNSDQITASDTTCCHSTFSIVDGAVTHVPATIALKSYHTLFNGTTLRIYN